MTRSVHAEALSRAAEILGGKGELRAYLRVPMRELEAWLKGVERPPTHVFLAAVDVISSKQRAYAYRDHAERVHAALLAASQARAARRRKLEAEEFASAEFAPHEARRMVDSALSAALCSTNAARANIQLVAPDGLRIVSHIGFKEPFLRFFECVDTEQPSACSAAHRRAARIIVPDVESDPIFAGTPSGDIMRAAEVRAVQSTPLVDARGSVIGMLSTHYEKPHEPSKKELAAIDLIVAHTAEWIGGAPKRR